MRHHYFFVAGAALVLAACGGKTAPSRTIAMNGEVTAELRSSDPRLNDNSVYHLYTFQGSEGQIVQIDVMSSDFDAFAILQDAAGNELTRDDDGGDGLDARITYTLPNSGTYRVVANTYRADRFGSYRIRLTGLAASSARSGMAVRRNARVTGRLTSTDPRMADNSVFHYYLYNGRAGETITVDVMSREFDAYAIIQDATGNELSRDDDSGEGTNARVTFRLPTAGQYRIVVNTYTAGSYGTYTLWVH